MDTCVRNGVYDEALDLHALLTRVALLHPDMPIAKMLAAQVCVRACVCAWTAGRCTRTRQRRLQPLHGSMLCTVCGANLPPQAQAVSRAMLAQLLGRLRTNIALPECLRVIGYLRRMAAFSEAELRLQFLRCRCACVCMCVCVPQPASRACLLV
jgi:hypothetical protein